MIFEHDKTVDFDYRGGYSAHGKSNKSIISRCLELSFFVKDARAVTIVFTIGLAQL